MRQILFLKMKEVTNEEQMKRLQKYDKFLYGPRMLEQKETKQVGQQITYYEVISKEGLNIEYTPIYDVLEKD